jgi:hypothetical protein
LRVVAGVRVAAAFLVFFTAMVGTSTLVDPTGESAINSTPKLGLVEK